MSNPVFKPCMQHQPRLLPLDIGDMIPKSSMVRVVDSIIDSIDHRRLYELYPGGGASAYDPVMLLKVVVFAYACGIYSSRRIAQDTRDNVNFLWLTGLTPIDHNTLNRFRSERILPVFEDIFSEVIALLAEQGFVTLDTYFLDGTKIEASANKFTFVWKKSTDHYMDNLRRKVHAHLQAIDEMEEAEDELAFEEPGEVDADAIREAAERINERLKGKPKDKELKKAKKAFEQDYLPRMEHYERQQVLFDSRNSYSKTDTDATFMRMKDDAMGNGQLKAGYNIQVGTENQIIVDSTVHRRPGDTACTIPHLEHLKESLGALPQRIVADAGYGSEENYAYLESQGVEAYVKHQEFFRECKNEKWREDEMRVANWTYDEEDDAYTCPEGRKLIFKWESHPKSDLGHRSVTRVYECIDCSACSRRKHCIKSPNPEYRRRIGINPTMDFFKQRASEMLHTEEGSRLRKKRSVDVETVFGDIKRNHGFTRFHLRGLDKVSLEWRLVAMGHNMRKITLAMRAQGA
jgi:transposase